MDLLHYYAYDQAVSIGIALVGLLFFGALTIDSLVRGKKRVYLPGLLLIDFGILNNLVRNLFFFELSPHPARVGGVWRILTVSIIVWGFVRFFRTWQQERATVRSDGR